MGHRIKKMTGYRKMEVSSQVRADFVLRTGRGLVGEGTYFEGSQLR
jgi:hypothetical protein